MELQASSTHLEEAGGLSFHRSFSFHFFLPPYGVASVPQMAAQVILLASQAQILAAVAF